MKTIAINSCYDSHVTNAWTTTSTGKEHQIAWLKIAAFYSLTVGKLSTTGAWN